MQPSEVYYAAVKVMRPEDIDHHGLGHGMDDLYLRVNDESRRIISELEPKSLLGTFKDYNGDEWYELPFCYPIVEANKGC